MCVYVFCVVLGGVEDVIKTRGSKKCLSRALTCVLRLAAAAHCDAPRSRRAWQNLLPRSDDNPAPHAVRGGDPACPANARHVSDI